MSRISPAILDAKDFPMPGRLTPLDGSYDAGDKTICFLVPSQSRQRSYVVWVDCLSGETCCSCEDWKIRRKSRQGYQEHATWLEREAAKRLGVALLPLITRLPSGLCPHTRRVRQWLKAHKVYPILVDIVETLERRLDNRRMA